MDNGRKFKAGDVVFILGGANPMADPLVKYWGLINTVHTLIDSFPGMIDLDKSDGWLGIKYKDKYFTINHFNLVLANEYLAEPDFTNNSKENKMHIEPMPKQFKLVLGTEDLKLIIGALRYSAGSCNPNWTDDVKDKAKEYATKLDNARKGV